MNGVYVCTEEQWGMAYISYSVNSPTLLEPATARLRLTLHVVNFNIVMTTSIVIYSSILFAWATGKGVNGEWEWGVGLGMGTETGN